MLHRDSMMYSSSAQACLHSRKIWGRGHTGMFLNLVGKFIRFTGKNKFVFKRKDYDFLYNVGYNIALCDVLLLSLELQYIYKLEEITQCVLIFCWKVLIASQRGLFYLTWEFCISSLCTVVVEILKNIFLLLLLKHFLI